MLGAHDVGVHDAGGGVQRVHGRVDAELGDGAGQHGGGVQVSEGGGGRGVGKVIGRHIDGLGGDGRGWWDREGTRRPWCGVSGAALTCTEVMEPLRVVVMRSCMVPMSVASVGW